MLKRFRFKRNQVIITALVAMISVAGYLNWQDAQNEVQFAQAIALDDHGQIIPTTDWEVYDDFFDDMFLHDAPWIASEFDFTHDFDSFAGNGHASEPGEAVFVNAGVSTTASTPFFVQARLEREQSRARQTDILMNMIGEQTIDMEQRAVITDAMLEIQRRIERETATEAMLSARGFQEAYVRIADQYIDIVVARDALSDAELAQIEDAVRRNTGMNVDQIRVSPMRQ